MADDDKLKEFREALAAFRIKAETFKDKKKGLCVRVTRSDVPEPMIYDKDTDGYAYWLAQAKRDEA